MQVNEGLPAYIVSALERRYGGLEGKTVGILGMAFKAESDDPRASLSYKLRKLLTWAGARVVCTDPYVSDDRLTTLELRPRGERDPRPRRAPQGVPRARGRRQGRRRRVGRARRRASACDRRSGPIDRQICRPSTTTGFACLPIRGSATRDLAGDSRAILQRYVVQETLEFWSSPATDGRLHQQLFAAGRALGGRRSRRRRPVTSTPRWCRRSVQVGRARRTSPIRALVPAVASTSLFMSNLPSSISRPARSGDRDAVVGSFATRSSILAVVRWWSLAFSRTSALTSAASSSGLPRCRQRRRADWQRAWRSEAGSTWSGARTSEAH